MNPSISLKSREDHLPQSTWPIVTRLMLYSLQRNTRKEWLVRHARFVLLPNRAVDTPDESNPWRRGTLTAASLEASFSIVSFIVCVASFANELGFGFGNWSVVVRSALHLWLSSPAPQDSRFWRHRQLTPVCEPSGCEPCIRTPWLLRSKEADGQADAVGWLGSSNWTSPHSLVKQKTPLNAVFQWLASELSNK